MKLAKYTSIMFLFSILNISCGKSLYKSLEKKDAAVEATLALEDSNPEGAISILLNELGGDFEDLYNSLEESQNKSSVLTLLTAEIDKNVDGGNSHYPNLVSILATAKAQLHGIDPFKLALKYVENATNTTSQSNLAATPSVGSNELTLLFPVLPAATDENIDGLDSALTLISAIEEYKTNAEEYKHALLLTASIALATKALDSDGDGQISAAEALNLPDAAAKALVNQILAAATTAGNTEGKEESISKEQIIKIQEQINKQQGTTQEEKLKNFIVTQQSPN